jgi:hypothetical protein
METPKKKHKEEYIKPSPIKEDNNIIKENDTTKEDDNNLKKEKVENVEKEEKEKLNKDIKKEEKNEEKLNNNNNEGEKQDNIIALKEKQNEKTEEIEVKEGIEENEEKEKSIKNKEKKEKKEVEKINEDNEIEIHLEENSNIQKEKERIENENSGDEISSHSKKNSSNKTPIKRRRRRNKRKRKFMPLKKKNKNKKYSFEVEKILDIKVIDGTKFYKCKWVGYPTKDSSYEPITSFEDPNIINVLLKDYNKSIKDKDSNKKSLSEKNKNNQLKQVYMLENNNKNEKIGNNIKIPNLDDVKKINEKYINLDKNFINIIIKGDIEKDIPKKFITVLQNNEDPTSLFIEIEWKKRKNGIQPGNSTYTNKKIREKFPSLLLDYYENFILLQHKREREFGEKIEKDFI